MSRCCGREGRKKNRVGAPRKTGRKSPAKQGEQPSGGGTRFTPTEEQRIGVAGLVALGTRQEVIAEILGIVPATLKKYFRDELARGKEKFHSLIGNNINALAAKGDKTMLIFYAKAQMGWRETDRRIGFVDAAGNPTDPPSGYTIQITG